MEEGLSQQIVTVSVSTYNSSKYVIETLESIKGQTWKDLILQVSDDCSTDGTVELCREWIESNKSRFVETRILTIDHNTGVSANANRAWDACTTEYYKSIAGDDLLLPNCVEDNMRFICLHPDAVVVFSRVKGFRIKNGKYKWMDIPWHDYSFFSLSSKEQYHYLFHKGNHLPAASCFYNIKKIRNLGIRHDERIPLLEDYPKWIMFARKGVHFTYMDKLTVGYRINEKSLSIGLFSPLFFKSNLLFYLYYYQEEIKKEEERDVIYNLMCDEVLKFYTKTYNNAFEIKNSKSYKLGHFMLAPLRYLLIFLKLN